MSRWQRYRVVYSAQTDSAALGGALRSMAGSWSVFLPDTGFQFIHPDAPRDFKPRTSLGAGLVPQLPTPCDECSGVDGAHKAWCGT